MNGRRMKIKHIRKLTKIRKRGKYYGRESQEETNSKISKDKDKGKALKKGEKNYLNAYRD